MQFRLNISQTQKLKQHLSPKLIQMFKVYQSSYAELHDQIIKEQEQNVFIETVQTDTLLKQSNTNKTSTEDSEYDFTHFSSEDEFSTIREFAFSQLNLIRITEKQHNIISKLIENLNDNGYILNFSAVANKIQKT